MRLALLAAALATAPAALGHGVQTRPPSRHEEVCGNRESGDSVMRTGCTGGGGTFGFGGGTPGLCGDGCMRSGDEAQERFGPTDYKNKPCMAEPEVFVEGSVIPVEWIINAFHGGFIECNLCDDAFNLSQECFDKYPLETVGPSTGGQDADPVRVHERPSGEVEGNTQWWVWAGRDSVNPVQQMFKLPDGVVSELATIQCVWWTGHVCMFECDEAVCGEKYSQGINNIAWPEGNVRYDNPRSICPSRTPGDGEAPQMYAQCGEIKIVADEEEMPPPPSGNGNFEGLAVIDIASGATVRLTHMGQDTVDLTDYPEGLSVQAEFLDNDLVESVTFETDDGYAHTEFKVTFDMFGTERDVGPRPWPGVEPGLLVKVTVTARMTDGTEDQVETTIDFQETFGQ